MTTLDDLIHALQVAREERGNIEVTVGYEVNAYGTNQPLYELSNELRVENDNRLILPIADTLYRQHEIDEEAVDYIPVES